MDLVDVDVDVDVDVKVWSGFMWLRLFTSYGACVNMMINIVVPYKVGNLTG
jgi:hypothetical protein